MMIQLRPISDGLNGETTDVRQPIFSIGRANGCDLQILVPTVSRQHCQLRIEGTEVWVLDNDSTNGTFVDRQRVLGVHELHDGSILEVGPVMFEVHIALTGRDRISKASQLWCTQPADCAHP